MKRIILTGANGFIGRQAIKPLLERGYEVHAISNVQPPADLKSAGVLWHKANLLHDADIADLTNSIRATHLLHFAWYVEHGKFWNAPENKEWTAASLKLLDCFIENGGERVVMSGTCVEYDLTGTAILSESETDLQPSNLYGECKVELQRQLAVREISHAWGRLFFLYGEFESPRRLVPSVISSLLRNDAAECSHGRQVRDFIYVKDAAEAFVALLDSDVEGAVNIASGEPVTIKDLVLTIADHLGKRENVRFGPVASPTDEPPIIVANVKRLTNEVEWKPSYNLNQGIEKTIEWWRNQ
jgi:nucleoside-diphosphate-sugar epimerase